MARAPRIEYAGAVYHILSRGQRRETIVRDEEDCKTYMQTLSEVCDRTGWLLHAWVLMPNHYHWLLETPEANLVAGMQWFQTAYCTRFRMRHRLVGHVLQGRYKALLVQPDSDTYFQSLSGYIHLNPARASGLLRAEEPLESYRWSSYPLYRQGPGRRPSYLVVDRVLGNMGLEDDRVGRRRYAAHMTSRCEKVRSGKEGDDLDAEWKVFRRGWYVGGNEFRDTLLERLDGVLARVGSGSVGGAAVREHHQRAAGQWIDKALEALEISAEDLPKLRKTDARKRVIAWWVRTHSTVSNRWVANELHMGHEMNASASIRKVQEARGDELDRWRRLLEKKLRI